MNIKEMSDQEKSVVLARLMGWKIAYGKGGVLHISNKDIFGFDAYVNGDLYHVDNMAMAWRVLNWMMNYPIKDESSYRFLANFHFRINFGELLSMPPAAAQRLWLDKILELAIEAGMVNDD